MFDIGWGELVVIGIVALIVIGPKELPTVLRTVGQWATKVRRMASEFQGQFQEAMREAEFAELKKQVDSIQDVAKDLPTSFDPLDTARKEMESAFEAKPAAAEAPAPATVPPAETAAAPAAADASATPSAAGVDAPLPEPAPPVGDKDFAAEPEAPPKPEAGGGRAA